MNEELPHLQAIRARLGSFPKFPGVYLMRDAAQVVIYVGKAKDLRARLRTYFSGGDGRLQISYLLGKLRTIETIVTENENQAFILERDLITKYKPRYNIRLKDDKAYLNIRIDTDAAWPRLELVRKVDDDGAHYFGPYSFSYELRALLEIVKRVVPLRTCTDTVFYNRQRPCLEYQIKRCAGPCCLSVDRTQYMRWVRQAMSILEGKSDALVKELSKQMEQASEDLRFEEAAVLRDRISVLQNAKSNQLLSSGTSEDRDVFGLYREEALAALSVLRVRSGHISETVNFSFSEVRITDEEILEAALGQFYEVGREIPDEIVIPFAVTNQSILERAFCEKREEASEIIVPQRGSKFRLSQLAQLNARQHFISAFESEKRSVDLMKELARTLKLKQIPRRVECVDISNLQGSDIVGAVVAFFDGVPDKKSYKKYVISFQDKPNDFAAMHEVVTRRLTRGLEEGDFPDLLIIDGGPGQLSKALEAREQLKLNLEIISLAKMKPVAVRARVRKEQRDFSKTNIKKPERIYVEGSSVPIALDATHPVTHFLQRIRDEAHRFVISFHRMRRGKRVLTSVLDDISGIGPERKNRLLRAFGTVARIREATPEEISTRGRMPLPLARKVLRFLTE